MARYGLVGIRDFNQPAIGTIQIADLTLLTADFAGLAATAAKFASGTFVGADIPDGILTPNKFTLTLAGYSPLLIVQDFSAAAAEVAIYNNNAPYGFYVLDAWLICTGANAGGTALLHDTPGGGGNNITDAMVCAVDETVVRAATIDLAFSTVVLNGSLTILKNAAADKGIMFVSGYVM